ncbi:hypothetical protein [Acinetobacter sp. MD2]|uniref:hypothetical protein n=1 Tax=Acinetobacter sp. MD2 TaxID=2600066 RepID=UPI002D1F0F72|nr:hypothetical protein [Acinetobacter sp. MD2]MEB3767728.1 hypothetical protein [Acinetobacter sp. MD2]
MSKIFLLLMGIFIGFLMGRSSVKQVKEQEPKKPTRRAFTYSQRQYLKVMYASDADRIRELNLLSANDSIFLRLLKQEFSNKDVVVKDKRFFIVDGEKFPIAIFEYRDGVQGMRTMTIEDGLPLFLYKGILSSEKIREDAKLIDEQYLRK